MNLKHIQAFVTVWLFVNTGSVVMFGQNCTQKDMNTTIVCNYIPADVDKNVSHVYIVDYTNTVKEVLTKTNFSSQNWRHVEYLELGNRYKVLQARFYFEANCFEELTDLKEFRLHINQPIFSPEAFMGLGSLTTLDFSGCKRLKYSNMVQALNGSLKMPRLQNLYLSSLSQVYRAFPVNNSFVEILLPRNINVIDLGNSALSMLNFTAIATKLKQLQVLNLSYSAIAEDYAKNLYQNDLRHIKVIDLTGATLPQRVAPLPGKIVLKNLHLLSSKLHHTTKLGFTSETMNYSAVIRKYSSVWLYNVTVVINDDLQWTTRDLILQQNNLKRLDIKINCTEYNITSIELIDLSKNEMEFLHPSFFQCMPNLKTVHLSNNNLYIMVAQNASLFERNFFKLKSLTHIFLAANLLECIPKQLFLNNEMIETIDLSKNKLKQVNFDLQHLINLRLLDLRSNEIVNLDSGSINNLNAIPRSTQNYSTTVLLTSNPISCSKCTTKAFLKWILTTNLTDERSQKLTCITENGKNETITNLTLRQVQEMCTRNISILVGSVSGSIMILLFVIVLAIFIKKRHARGIKKRDNVISLLQKGEGEHEFVAYMAYSSDDQDFVAQYVLHVLNEELRLMTGVDRELICTGDEHLRCGFDINSEIVRCIERSSVTIIIVSKNFCTSKYCQIELNQAYVRNKPIMLMFKEYVPEELMNPQMKELYRKNVRILWAFENGSYQLKSSWKNVCTSILDLIK